MKVYKLKFIDKEGKKLFSYFNGLPTVIDNDKKKSVIVKAKNKNAVRDMIERTERTTYNECIDGYCFGEENEDYWIKKIADDEKDYNEKD